MDDYEAWKKDMALERRGVVYSILNELSEKYPDEVLHWIDRKTVIMNYKASKSFDSTRCDDCWAEDVEHDFR